MNRKISLELGKEIIKLSATQSQLDIAKRYNISQSAVCHFLCKNDIKNKKSRLNMSRLNLDINYFEFINTNEKAYWLGYICADGNINKLNNKVTITSIDEERLIKFKNDVKSEHKIAKSKYFDKRTNKTYERYTIQIGNELFTKFLILQGVTNNKTNICEFPNIDEKYFSYFIAGLFDGDGSVSKLNNNIKINLISSLEILSFIQSYLLRKLGINKLSICRVTKNKPNVWKLYLYKDAALFLRFIYNDISFSFMQRKYERYINYLK